MNCLVCDGKLSEYLNDSCLKLPVFHCVSCNLFVTGNNYEEIKKKIFLLYKEEYWDERGAEKSIKSNYTDKDSEGKKRNWISQFAYCKPYLKNKKKILEIGVGAGQAAFWFEQIGFQITGIEPDGRNVALINKKLKNGYCIEGNIEDFHINDEFDIIWMSHVLEHLLRPDEFLKKIKQNLVKDGIFFIEVPNCEDKKMLKASISEPHIFHFSKNALSNLLKHAGFSIVRCDIFRPATIFEGGINIISKKLHMKNFNPFPFYPRIRSNSHIGRDLRIIVTH